jgi:putative alpha-1,2-mannosidase
VARATLNLPNGKSFTVTADRLDDAHPYVGAVSLNGRPLANAYVRHEEVVAGGTLHFTMASKPNKAWASAPAAPPSRCLPTGDCPVRID